LLPARPTGASWPHQRAPGALAGASVVSVDAHSLDVPFDVAHCGLDAVVEDKAEGALHVDPAADGDECCVASTGTREHDVEADKQGSVHAVVRGLGLVPVRRSSVDTGAEDRGRVSTRRVCNGGRDCRRSRGC